MISKKGKILDRSEYIFTLTLNTFTLILVACFFILYIFSKSFKERVIEKADNSIFIHLDKYFKNQLKKKEKVRKESNDIEPNKKLSFYYNAVKNGSSKSVLTIWESLFCLSCSRFPCYWSLKSFFSRIWDIITKPIKTKLKMFCFIIICFAYTICTPIERIIEIIYIETDCIYPVYIVQMIISPLKVFYCVFLFSFLTNRREYLRVNSDEKQIKGDYIYYYFEKAILFASLSVPIALISYILAPIEIGYILFKLGRNIFYLQLIKMKKSLKYVQIKNDCDVLKEESKTYEIINYFAKNLISQERMSLFFRKSKKYGDEGLFLDEESFKKNLNRFKKCKLDELKIKLKILDEQKPKNILVRKNRTSYFPLFTIILHYVDCYCCFVVCGLTIVFRLLKSDLDNDEFDQVLIIYTLINDILECFVLPMFNFISLKKIEDENNLKKNIDL